MAVFDQNERLGRLEQGPKSSHIPFACTVGTWNNFTSFSISIFFLKLTSNCKDGTHKLFGPTCYKTELLGICYDTMKK